MLVLLAGISARGAAGKDKKAADDANNWLFCNTTSQCRVRTKLALVLLSLLTAHHLSPWRSPLHSTPPLPLQSCGALQLNEHCRAAGGYAVAQCLVSQADWQGPAEFKRELSSDEGLQVGTVVTQHRGCTPQSSFTVGGLMTLCALVAAAALLVVRLRAHQLRRHGL
jgi:uncharacterized protein YfiM (DUF2279 family)